MTSTLEFDERLMDTLRSITAIGIHNAVRGFSGLLGHKLEFGEPNVKLVPLTQIPMIVGGPENEAVGIYLRAEGEFHAQIMMILPLEKAYQLVDLLMEQPEGSTTFLGSLERSALGEVGNMTGTFFMNAVANALGREIRPTPPAVMVDMVGAILDIIVATTGGVSDHVLLIQTCFKDGSRSVLTDFWVIPDAQSLQALRQVEKKVMKEPISVNLGEVAVSSDPTDVLVAYGLGSCLGITMVDKQRHICGLLHAVLPHRLNGADPYCAKYVDSGIEGLLNAMLNAGADRRNLIVRIAGGANMLTTAGLSKTFDVGTRNIESARETLRRLNLPLHAEETGGHSGRTVRVYVASGRVTVRVVGGVEKDL